MENETKSTSPLTPPTPQKSHFLKSFFIVISLVFFGIAIGILSAHYFPFLKASNTVNPVITPVVNQTNGSALPTTSDKYSPSYIAASSDNRYLLYFYSIPTSQSCKYSLYDQEKKMFLSPSGDYHQEEQFLDLNCSANPQSGTPAGLVTNAAGWLTDTSYFLNDSANGQLSIINIANNGSTGEVINYPAESWRFLGVDQKALKYLWLNNEDYLITDTNLNLIRKLEEFKSDSVWREILLNPINNGVLVIQKLSIPAKNNMNSISLSEPQNQCTCKPEDTECTLNWYKFSFYNFTDNTYKTLLNTESNKELQNMCGRGCYSTQIFSSAKGKISIHPDCFTLDEKYYDSEENINLRIL